LGPETLAQVLRPLILPTDPALLTDLSDDAAVYRLGPEQALVQTVDFFTPIVDDPYTYGAIAAANSLSDVYAMGARPILALAVASMPDDLPAEIITAIFQGGADKVAEAGAVIAGGHTVADREPKYGLCVTGLAHPDQITLKGGARPGDVLLLSKPIGTGLVTTAAKQGKAAEEHLQEAIASMMQLNRVAAELVQAAGGAHGATDITGFGLLGHAAEIALNAGVQLRFDFASIPFLPGAVEYAKAGITMGGLNRNREWIQQQGRVSLAEELIEWRINLLCDPQTSGGLLVALPPERARTLLAEAEHAGIPIWQVGDVVEGHGVAVV
jgi:selenide,water dikinase